MPQLCIVCRRVTVSVFREEYCATMIRGYVAVVSGDSASVDILPDSAACKKTAVKLTTADEDRFEFYISIKGTDYSFKVIGNMRTVDKHNIAGGRLRIGFIVPDLDIVVAGNPKELEAFVYTLVAIKDPRVLPPMCSDSTHKRDLKYNYREPLWSDILVGSCLVKFCSICCFRILQGYSRDDAHKIVNIWKSSIDITDRGMRLNSITVNSYTYLMEINASYSDLVQIPEALGSLPSLTTLNLEGNRLGQATNWNCLTSPFLRENLSKLYLSYNEITDRGRRLNSITVNSYPYLNEIVASSSELVEIPEALGSLPCLTTLDLSDNRLGEATNWNWLTSPFLRENLSKLYLSYNELHSIPEAISGLRNLKILNLNRNYLTELPAALGSLKFLRELYISGNKLVILPGWMYRKERFSGLETWDNEFERARDMFDIVAKPQLQRNEFQTVIVPSLLKTVATYIIVNSLAFWEYNIPATITKDLEAAYICRCGSVVFPDTTGPVVQCWIDSRALTGSNYSFVLPIAICCCSYECYKLIEPFFMDDYYV